MPALVEYIPKNSMVHRLNPVTKILWTFTVLILCFVFNEPLPIFIIFLSNLAVAALSGIINRILPVVRGLLIFSFILVLFQIFFVSDGNTLFYVLPFFKAGRITDMGLNLSMIMAFRMLATVSTVPILMMTTPMTDIVVVMVEKLKVPFKYTFMFVTALRFIPTFIAEMEQIMQAQMSRGYCSDTRNPFKKLVIILPLAVPLLISSVKKTENMAISMEVRGFGSGPRSHYREIVMQKADYCTIFLFIASILVCIMIKLLLPAPLF